MIHASIRGLGAALFLMAFAAVAQDSSNWDGLVQVKPKRLDAVFLLPGADFRVYNKIMMDPVEVAFEKDWAARLQPRGHDDCRSGSTTATSSASCRRRAKSSRRSSPRRTAKRGWSS